MKRILVYILIGFLALSYSPISRAQILDPTLSFDELIKGGGEDMSTYMGYYVEPFINGFGTGITFFPHLLGTEFDGQSARNTNGLLDTIGL